MVVDETVVNEAGKCDESMEIDGDIEIMDCDYFETSETMDVEEDNYTEDMDIP